MLNQVKHDLKARFPDKRLSSRSTVVKQNLVVNDLLTGKMRVPALHGETRSLDSYFIWWSAELPKGSVPMMEQDGKGNKKSAKLFADDVAQAARQAYFMAYVPHCHKGPLKCRSKVKFPRREVIKRHTKAKMVLAIAHKMSLSCEKNHLLALGAAKFAAMTEARECYRPFIGKSVKFIPFADLRTTTEGEQTDDELIGYLSAGNITQGEYAEYLGIASPWSDVTADMLDEALSSGSSDYMLQLLAKSDNARVRNASHLANAIEADIVCMRGDGLTWDAISRRANKSVAACKMIQKRYQQKVS